MMLYDQIALENHDYTATKAERIQNSKLWVLSINAEGPQLPRQQRPDYAAAKRECQRLQGEYMSETKCGKCSVKLTRLTTVKGQMTRISFQSLSHTQQSRSWSVAGAQMRIR